MLYDYKDAKGFERGTDNHGKKNKTCIYHLVSIDNEHKTARVEAFNAWGQLLSDVFPLHTLSKIEPAINR